MRRDIAAVAFIDAVLFVCAYFTSGWIWWMFAAVFFLGLAVLLALLIGGGIRHADQQNENDRLERLPSVNPDQRFIETRRLEELWERSK